MHFVLDSPRWPQLLRTYVPSLIYLPAVCYPSLTYLPIMCYPALQTCPDFAGTLQPFSELSELMCVVCAGWKGNMQRANPLCAPGKGSHAPGSPTQQTLWCPTGRAGRDGRPKSGQTIGCLYQPPNLPFHQARGLLGPFSSLFLLFHKHVLKICRSALSFHLS